MSRSAIEGKMRFQRRLICALTAMSLASACASQQPSPASPLGPEFGPVKELAPNFDKEAREPFSETTADESGRKFTGVYPGLVYRCAGREQEYFSFSEAEDGELKIHSRIGWANFPTLPDDLINALENRTAASDEDAIKKIVRSKQVSWSPFGIYDFIAYNDGWLIAYNLGEFGGALIWLPKEGDSYAIEAENTSDLEQVGDAVYAAYGLDHLSLSGGGIRLVKRYWRMKRLIRNPDDTVTTESERVWLSYEENYPAISAVKKVALRNDMIIGLTNYGLIVVGADKIVRYNVPKYENLTSFVQQAQDLFIARDGTAYVGGPDMIGIYRHLPNDLTPELYARKDCDFVFDDPPKTAD